MKFEIQEEVTVTKTIKVEIPFYYKEDRSDYSKKGNCITHGKIEETKTTTIRIQKLEGEDRRIDVGIKFHPKLKFSNLEDFLYPNYKSNSSEFEAFKNEAIAVLAKL